MLHCYPALGDVLLLVNALPQHMAAQPEQASPQEPQQAQPQQAQQGRGEGDAEASPPSPAPPGAQQQQPQQPPQAQMACCAGQAGCNGKGCAAGGGACCMPPRTYAVGEGATLSGGIAAAGADCANASTGKTQGSGASS